MLDAKEYLHLAINAMTHNDHHAALNYIKEVLAIEPRNASALYLLAAEHAELGLFDRAMDEMEQALAIDPNIEMARFQLGLLYLRSDQLQKASDAFGQLAGSSVSDAVRSYSEGLVALCNEDLSKARERLALGLSKPNDNPSLKQDMQNLLDKLLDGQKSAISSPLEEDSTVSPVFLGAYGSKV